MRIVSLVPSLTETLWSLGAGDDVVGVTHFCLHPREARERATRVGGTKNPKLDVIRDLQPDVVVVNVEENRLEDVDALRALGFGIHVTDVRTLDDARRMVEGLGELTDHGKEAADLVAAMEVAEARVREAASASPPLRVFVPIWRDPWMGVNGDTYAHHVLRACGAHNVAADLPDRYPMLEPEAVQELGPNHVLLPSEPYAFREKHREEAARVFGLPVDHVVLLDGEALTWYGARTPAGLDTVAATIRAFRRPG